MTLSVAVKVLSAVVTVALLATPVLVWGFLPGMAVGGPRGPAGPAVQAFARWGVGLAPLVAVLSWAFSPRRVEIEAGELRVVRRAWRAASWSLSEVERVELLPAGWLRGAVRTFGNGGLFGFYGWFYKAGAFRLLATRSDHLVEIVVGGRRVVVSPDDPARLVDGLRESAPRIHSRS